MAAKEFAALIHNKIKVGGFLAKAVAVGYEDIKEIIDRNRYYIDKTYMIRDLIEKGSKVNLFTRPRRFGKTLNLSMIRRFFEDEIGYDGKKISNSYLFANLEISSYGEDYAGYQERYPVISISLKSAKQPDYGMAYQCLVDEIIKEYSRHAYVLMGTRLPEYAKKRFEAVMNRDGERSDYATALEFLSYCLKEYHRQKVIILIDEYDVPLENSYLRDFYGEMTDFIRSLFESALKTNLNMEFAVITGCLRISRESIFTGLNNLRIYSILDGPYADCFGFTEEEVKQLLVSCGLEEKFKDVKKWYDGYTFGEREIYNPWSIINYVDTALGNQNASPQPYWSNTSSNSIVKKLIEEAGCEEKKEIEDLIAGGRVRKPVHEDITYHDIHESTDNLWNFLYFTGYLKKVKEGFEGDLKYMELMIPNMEVCSIYKKTILMWFDRKIKSSDRNILIQALETGNTQALEKFISGQLLDTISFFDYAENYYHGFLAGLLKGAGNYLVVSNRESGCGRPDLILKSPSVRGMAIILEIKIASNFGQMEQECLNALEQINNRKYEAQLRTEGYRTINKYGICFYHKECMVR